MLKEYRLPMELLDKIIALNDVRKKYDSRVFNMTTRQARKLYRDLRKLEITIHRMITYIYPELRNKDISFLGTGRQLTVIESPNE